MTRWTIDQAGPSEGHRRKKGTQSQAIGRSRDGLTTKTVALVEALGNLIDFVLLVDQRHDSKGAAPLIEGLTFDAFLGDKAFDNDKLRAELHERDAAAIISPKRNRKESIEYDREMYKWRHLVENFFAAIKKFYRIATCYDKTGSRFIGPAWVSLMRQAPHTCVMAGADRLPQIFLQVYEGKDVDPSLRQHGRRQAIAASSSGHKPAL